MTVLVGIERLENGAHAWLYEVIAPQAFAQRLDAACH